MQVHVHAGLTPHPGTTPVPLLNHLRSYSGEALHEDGIVRNVQALISWIIVLSQHPQHVLLLRLH